ncbi:11294_t:CDS:2 [Funneliformis mosseae]|uniref:11294_t:CDS:1 n=1 Tax=Funneliformis mosseae TaxID=27381 RepID=A0A9N9E1V9_FUNMO|nr:11294_t:CDS:2 [Funneliformis mosseae]
MTKINSSLPNKIDDFFDNILENEEDLISLFTEIAINKARELLVSDLDNVNNNSESTDWNTSSALTITSKNIINESIQSYGKVKNLQGLA